MKTFRKFLGCPRVLLLLLLPMVGCSLIACTGIKNTVSPPGQMGSDGRISPCHGHRRDLQSCGNALFNSTRVGKLALGQSLQQVRAAMEHDAEERSVRTDQGQTIEVWMYLVDYRRNSATYITFVDGLVSALDTRVRKR